MQDQDPTTVSFCPSFNAYSSHHLSAIADRVRGEERENLDGNGSDERNQNNTQTYQNDDDFEFVFVRTNPDDCETIASDQNPEITVFPLFDRDLLLEYEIHNQNKDHGHRDDSMESAISLPLRKLFIEDRDLPSSSSSEADELEGISPATYCVWSPSPSPSRCEKSNSTGSSSKQKWRLKDLFHLRRCSSDGKESFIFFGPNNHNNNKKHSESNSNSDFQSRDDQSTVTKLKKKTKEKGGEAGKAKGKVSAHEVFYVRSKAAKGGDKRRSYLPYRQDLFGFFANVNRTSAPF